MTAFNYIAFNDQLSFADDGATATYDAPDDFDAAGTNGLANIDQANAFVTWWMNFYDIEETTGDVKFWDGRTMVVAFLSEGVDTVTFLFEAL